MLLSDREIRRAIKDGRVVFDPPLADRDIQAASVDLTLHRVFWTPTFPTGEGLEFVADVTALASGYAKQFEAEEYILNPGEFLLGETAEGVSLADDMCGLIEGRSGRARHGLIVHCTAPHVAPGWGMAPPTTPNGKKVPQPKRITLEIANLGPAKLRLRAGAGIAQLMILQTGKPARNPYAGRMGREGS